MRSNQFLQALIAVGLAMAPGTFGAAPAGAARVQQDVKPVDVRPGLYVSDMLPAADSAERQYTLGIFDDGSATMSTTFMDEDGLLEESGSWVQDEAGNVVVTLTGTAAGEYDVPVVITFATLVDALQTVPDDPNYGVEGLTLTLAEAEVEFLEQASDVTLPAIAGTYVSKPSVADESARLAVLHLAEDGTALDISIALTQAAPTTASGTWTSNGGGTVTVTLTTTLAAGADAATIVTELAEVKVATLERGEDGTLRGDDLVLYPADTLGDEAATSDARTLLYRSNVPPAGDTQGRVVSLALRDDGNAALTTDDRNGMAPTVELGTWEEIAEGEILVILEGTGETSYAEPEEIVFTAADGVLTATEYDPARYGTEGIILTLAPDEGDAGMSAVGEVATMTYQSDVLPSTDTPGLQVTMVFGEDGSIQMLTDYLDGATAVVESGTWLRDGDVILVVITGTASEVYDEATEFTVETQEDGSILASSPEVFGSRGLLLTLRSTQ